MQPPAARPAGDKVVAKREPVRPPGAGARARSWRFIDIGDRHFKAARYRDALTRYRKAISTDEDLAAARFREAFAYLGLGNLNRAATSIRRGLQLDPDWPDSEFVLEDLFTNDAERKLAFQKVSERLDLLPNDSEARLLAGVMLHFDGDPDAAEKQFRRAIEIAGVDAAASRFLPDETEAE